MTGEQANWLRTHRAEGYQPIGVLPGGCTWVKRGMLHPDGTFEAMVRGQRPAVRQGSFEVGVLQHAQGAGMQGPV
jgi:hypothetical protein